MELREFFDGESRWLRGRDLNPRPLGYEPNELPGCSTPRVDSRGGAAEKSMKKQECSRRRHYGIFTVL